MALFAGDVQTSMLSEIDTFWMRFLSLPIPAVNVATVPQRSPLRYPGGKTWLIPHVRAWLSGINPKPKVLLNPSREEP